MWKIINILGLDLLSMEQSQKKNVAVPTVPLRIRSQRPLAPSVKSLTSNYKGDNEMDL